MACLDLRGRDCLVVGGGRVATEKAAGSSTVTRDVTVVAPEVDDELRAAGRSRSSSGPFARDDVEGRFLVVAATSDRAVNGRSPPQRRRADALQRRGRSRAVQLHPAGDRASRPDRRRRLDRRRLAGARPAHPHDIAELVGPEHAELARRLESLRPWAKRELPTYEARRDYFQRLVEEGLS